jgi:general secretion pathway protein K
MRSRNKQRERGAALAAVLGLVAIAATIATGLLQTRSAEMVRSESIQSARQAFIFIKGIEGHIANALSQSAGIDQLFANNGCRSPRLPVELANLDIVVQVENLHCRFNINSLASSQIGQRLFVDLIDVLTLQGRLSEVDGRVLRSQIIAWLSPQEAAPYLTADGETQLTAGQLFRSVSELSLLPGMSNAQWQALSPYVTALPVGDPFIDPQHSPDPLPEVLQRAEASGYQETIRFIQVEAAVSLNERVFHQCTIIDLEQSAILLRERVPCLP